MTDRWKNEDDAKGRKKEKANLDHVKPYPVFSPSFFTSHVCVCVKNATFFLPAGQLVNTIVVVATYMTLTA